MFTIKFEIKKSILINKNIEELKQTLTDFNEWNKWSPWLCLDNAATTSIKGAKNQVGHSQTWEGKLIGAGEMFLSKISHNRIEMDLFFKKPFKSHAPAWFEFKTINNQTEVTWGVINSLPFFLFFLKKMMIGIMGSSFEQGLERLKELAESGMINSVLSDVEISEQFSFYYIGENLQCSLDEISEKMPGAYEKVFQNIDANKLPQHDGYVCITHTCDLNTKHITLTAGVYFRQNPNSDLAQFIPAHQSLKLTHKGSYRYLRTAWSKMITYQRGNKIKINSKIPMFEFYLNNPHEVAEKDCLTEIHVALKH